MEDKMKSFLKIGFFMLAVIFSGSLMAQESIQSNSNLLNYYNTELFHWSYNMFGGLSLNLYNQSSSTMFGINNSMKEALQSYPDSSQEYNSYKWKNTTGNILMWGGLAAILGGAFIPLMGVNDSDNFDRYFGAYVGVTIGGAVTTLIGTFFLSSGQENLFYAVNDFNRAKIGDYK
jgi:hypothetical protein